jgi:hypothetical protein
MESKMGTVTLARGQPRPPFDKLCYVVTDVETDGPDPGANSMRSFASVVVEETGKLTTTVQAGLKPLPAAEADPGTLAWLRGQPAVWADINRDPQDPAKVIQAFVHWLRELPTPAVFVGNPLAFDGLWIDWYLRKFAGKRLICGPYGGEHLFFAAGLDLPSLIMGAVGWPYQQCQREFYPRDWFGGHAHTHRAIDDALGYANVLATMIRLINSEATHRLATGTQTESLSASGELLE